MQLDKIVALIDKHDAKLAVLLCHHNADPDALGSAYAFSGLLKRLRPALETEIGAASGPSKLGKTLLSCLPLKLAGQPRIEQADLIVLLDTNTIQQLDVWGTRISPTQPLVVIDHHASHPETEKVATVSVTDDNVSSACEVVYRLFKEAKQKPTTDEAKALFLGIAFDTRHFVIASAGTLRVVAELTELGVNPQETLPILSLPMETSERVARLKAGSRVDLLRVGPWLIALSHVSAFQASAARGLVSLGAHVAVVAGLKGDKIQVSFRGVHEFYEKTGIHLGTDLAKPLGEFLGGMGGGHSVSAGANGVGCLDDCFDFCSRVFKKKLG
ncbi:MAG: DHH family phosphoesterase [Candidatus Bathyarchaeia archaeon]|jgi:nanoRNase/pAp phosphatase (c-di-AMP/oligoRNAs hydrolase)